MAGRAGEAEDAARRAWFRREILPLEPELRAYVAGLVRQAPDVDDVLHDTFAKLIATSGWRQVEHPASFAMRVARNVVYDALRRQKVVAIDYLADVGVLGTADEAPGAEAVLLARDELRRLQAVVSSLPTQCRRVFTLRKVYDLSPQQIADQLGLSVSTVEKHLVKAVRLCSEGLAREPSPRVRLRKRSLWLKRPNRADRP